ncbi:AMP-binding domain protein [Protomyces lactucae-debilis]|uniref:AMP-binding domain protein n=1 Tax=Protomyces lactucae-debilis TaxID=2754530 RepID=A0A1Y2F6Q5_PROLT|nr:AMP-binding domain protein [Protomyces lactucae-debilis]ORY79539.1 AMP-binding domain protein [Protomyces lactucae-debilis]
MSQPEGRLRQLLHHIKDNFVPQQQEPPVPANNTVHGPAAHTGPRVHNYHELNPTQFLPKVAAINPDLPAILHYSANGTRLEYNYGEWSQRSCQLAYYMRKNTFKRNNVVAILASNTPMMLEAYFAIPAAGGRFTALNYRLQKSDIHYCLRKTKASTVLVDREYYDLVKEMAGEVDIVVDEDIDGKTGAYAEMLQEGQRIMDATAGTKGWAGLPYEEVDENSDFCYMFTSGTTSLPKAVTFTHRGVYMGALGNLIDSQLNCGDAFGGNNANYLWTLPIFHAAGWCFPWAVTLAQGRHITLRKMDYGNVWKLLNEEGVTHLCAAPTVCTLLINHPDARKLERPARVIVAASPPSASLFKSMHALNLNGIHVYGMTETYGPMMRGYFKPAWKEGSEADMYRNMARQGHGFSTSRAVMVIKPQPEDHVHTGTEQLVEVEHNGRELGEIAIHGNLAMKGYYDDVEATRLTFRSNYLLTGDLAVVHPDGYVEIQDRGKDVIISGGENISSIEVESCILKMPAVLECAVVAKKDEKWGEIPVAVLTCKNGQAVSQDEVIAWARKTLAGYKVPKEVVLVKDLPKTGTGKVQKNVLRAKIKAGEAL